MNSSRLWIVAVLLAFAFGLAVRIVPLSSFRGIGFDEKLYNVYTTMTARHGLAHYPELVTHYIEVQQKLTGSVLPPLRFLYIGTSALWANTFGVTPDRALRQVASFFSILTLAVTFAFMLRMAGRGPALAVLALMACAPTQIHMSQHALVDGFFTFWATLTLWMLWENLRRPNSTPLMVAYVAALTLMTLTKENSAFVFIAILAILITNRWLDFGTVTRPLVLATFLGPLFGVVGLVLLAGGVDVLIACYSLSVSKNFTLFYAIMTGDGPWYRYLVDLMLVSPVVLILAIGTVFQLDRTAEQRPLRFVAVFIGASYLIMCNLKYGMNLRYSNMWDSSLRLLAFAQFGMLTRRFELRRPELWLAVAVVLLCAYEFRHYWIFAIQFDRFYELITEVLLRAVKILK